MLGGPCGGMIGERGGDGVDGVEVSDCWCDVESAGVEWSSRPGKLYS